ncbi:hypothetical protein BGX38DRAFT_119208 [Terfezia claveryi]|nr:hypothetical protein BGX38DRAFT_119208 [Terfezia claveryi]
MAYIVLYKIFNNLRDDGSWLQVEIECQEAANIGNIHEREQEPNAGAKQLAYPQKLALIQYSDHISLNILVGKGWQELNAELVCLFVILARNIFVMLAREVFVMLVRRVFVLFAGRVFEAVAQRVFGTLAQEMFEVLAQRYLWHWLRKYLRYWLRRYLGRWIRRYLRCWLRGLFGALVQRLFKVR